MLAHGRNGGADPGDGVRIDTQEGLARALRQLRRRLARQRNDAPLTYRELAATTGWAHGVIGDYFAGKTLPPTDRFDVLVGLLGATPAEQGQLATARDQVEEVRRLRPKIRPHAPVPMTRLHIARMSDPPEPSTVDSRQAEESAFVAIALRVAWATMTMVDIASRPWSHVVHPLWELRSDGLTGWVLARSPHVMHSPFVSLSYWHPTHDTAIAQCEADWAGEHERRHAWRLASRTPPPAGHDPAAVWPAGVDSTDCAVLRLRPWRLTSSSAGAWTSEAFAPDP
ncbi:MAG TPA: helix-turn-helix transcriptional regulator [Pseudonocardiaceae bacterium]